MAKAFGFNDSVRDMEDYHSKANNAMKELQNIADDMEREAKAVFMQKSRRRTGQGEAGTNGGEKKQHNYHRLE